MLKLVEEIIGSLGAASIQRAATDDDIISDHIDDALIAAKELRKLIAIATEKAIP